MDIDNGERRPSASQHQRLPVNPRRHKVAPEQRKRVATACNNCNVRRVKCSGGNPCRHCSSSGRDCIYPTPVEKVNIPRAEWEGLKKMADIYERALQETIPDPVRRQGLIRHISSRDPSPSPISASGQNLSGTASPSVASSTPRREQDDFPTAGRLVHGPDGTARFLGEASGTTFLEHLKEILTAVLPITQPKSQMPQDPEAIDLLSGLGQYDTDEAQPWSDLDLKPVTLPSGDVMANMFMKLRHLIQDGNDEWSSGGIFWWGDLNALPKSASSSSPSDPFRHLAFYHAALAITKQADVPVKDSTFESANSECESFFALASSMLGNPLDITHCCTIDDVTTLCLMAFYLLETNRRDAAYMHVAAAMHICLILGVHRGLVDERGKRVFWTVYIMDRWLSSLMGRPHIISDDAIRMPLPVDEMDLPPAAGLRAHVDLSRISGYIVCNTYRAAPWEPARGEVSKQPDSAIWMLQQWQTALPTSLQLSPLGLSDDPACCLLHMRCNMLFILTVRPILLAAVKNSVARRLMVHSPEPSPRSEHLGLCMTAARRNIHLARHMRKLSIHGTKPLHSENHFTFHASVCLILEELVFGGNACREDLEVRGQDIAFGIEMDEQMHAHSGLGAPSKLRQLWSLISRLRPSEGLPTANPMPPLHQQQQHLQPHQQLPVLRSNLPRLQINEDHALYDELVAWVEDDLPIQNAATLALQHNANLSARHNSLPLQSPQPPSQSQSQTQPGQQPGQQRHPQRQDQSQSSNSSNAMFSNFKWP